MRRVRAMALVFGLAVTMAACGKGGGLTTSGGFALRVQVAGGFLPPGADMASVPEFAVTADGRVVTGGPQIEIYPGPAMPNVLQRTITDDGVAAIAAAARTAGLFGPDRHYGNDSVADAGTTFFTLVADGETHVVSAYALGDAAEGPGTSGTDRDARAKLQRFRERLGDLASWLPAGSLGDEEPYDITALRVVARAGGDNPDDGVTPNEQTWPLGPLATFGTATGDVRCGIVSGADLEKVLPLARKATQITIWRSEGEPYALQFRPQLPDETACEVPRSPQG